MQKYGFFGSPCKWSSFEKAENGNFTQKFIVKILPPQKIINCLTHPTSSQNETNLNKSPSVTIKFPSFSMQISLIKPKNLHNMIRARTKIFHLNHITCHMKPPGLLASGKI
jgi:hypothetical protein